MCGLIGGINLAGGADSIKRGVPWLKRRGPDSQGVWASEDGQVVLLHARLSIVDRDPRSNQPYFDPEQDIVVGFVGEIYNYSELKARLSDYDFQTESDTEVVLAVYSRYGVTGFRLLKGMYTIALIDQKHSRIFLVRDPIGKKPLFLASWNSQVLFGSSVLPLVASVGGEVGIETELMGAFWDHGCVPADMSLVTGVQPIRPGDVVELDWRGNVVAKHLSTPEPEILYDGESLEASRSNVQRLLSNSVRRRLSNNPSPISLLSGGLDSTIVTREMKSVLRHSEDGTKVKTLTLGAVLPLTNDERFARYAARKLDVDNEVLRLNLRGLGDLILRSLDIQDEPLAMPSYFILERLVSLASNHGRVLVTGDGGDEVFLGYRQPENWKKVELGGGDDVGGGFDYKLSSPDWMSDWGKEVSGRGFVGHMLAKADRASAEQGVEIRCPLLDWDLVCYVRSLPFEMLVNGNRSKALLKDLMGDWPSWFTERRKLGFTFNLRWLWSFSNYAGLRENVSTDAIQTFSGLVPPKLRKPANQWSFNDVLENFIYAWRLLVWSRFEERMTLAGLNRLS